uniref:Uncharacterized protein n=1 Tax=Solanum tuberosum TaxID=4113 RepID=M0ZYH7_SOLTU
MQTQSNFMKFKEEIHGGAHFRMIFAKIESSPLFKFELGQYGTLFASLSSYFLTYPVKTF